MPGWLESLLIKLIFALGDVLIAKGSKYYAKWSDMREAIKKADKYEEVINNPDSSLEDRLRAEDDLLN